MHVGRPARCTELLASCTELLATWAGGAYVVHSIFTASAQPRATNAFTPPETSCVSSLARVSFRREGGRGALLSAATTEVAGAASSLRGGKTGQTESELPACGRQGGSPLRFASPLTRRRPPPTAAPAAAAPPGFLPPACAHTRMRSGRRQQSPC
eukprot:354498-Chlamydomonas_euryale.AAC.6